MIHSVPKLISNISESAEEKLDYDIAPPKAPLKAGVLSAIMPGLGHAYSGEETKAFLLIVASVCSGSVLAFLFLLASISPESLVKFVGLLENLPFFDITVSPKTVTFIESLRFPNAFTIAFMLACFIYTGFAIFDSMQTVTRSQQSHRTIIPGYKKEAFYESSAISYAIHCFLLLIILISGFLFITPKKPQVQISQIEFIPTQRVTTKKPPKTTKRRAAKDSIDSGKHNPKKPVQAITKAPGSPGRGASSPKAAPKPKPRPKPKTPPKPTQQKPSKPKLSEFKPFKPSTPSPKPRSTVKSPTPTTPKRYIPAPSTYKSSPSNAVSTSAPAPRSDVGSTSSAQSGDRSSTLVARLSNIPRSPSSGTPGQGGAYGAPGNPGANPYGDQPPSVAARQSADLGPYMSALQRRIKLSWKPPKGSESSRIVVVFTVMRNGSVSDVQITVSSGSPAADNAAIAAVKRAAPFKPLPANSPDFLDIEFTFDYSVFQKSRY